MKSPFWAEKLRQTWPGARRRWGSRCRRGGAHLVAVQGQGRLHTQGIPCARDPQDARPAPPDGSTATRRPRCGRIPHSPEARRYSRSWRCGPSDPPGRHGAQGVLGGLLVGDTPPVRGHEHLLALGTLDGDGSPFGADVGDGAVEARRCPVQMLQVLVDVGGVDHQQVVVLLEQIQIRVVHGAPFSLGMMQYWAMFRSRALTLLVSTCWRNSLRWGPRPAGGPCGTRRTGCTPGGIQVLGDDAGGILDGHFPPPKSTMVAPAATWTSYSCVRFSSLILFKLLLQIVPSFLGREKRRKAACLAPPYLPERFPRPRWAGCTFGGRTYPAFSGIVRTRSLCLSFCVPLRRRARSLSRVHPPMFPIPLSCPFYHGAEMVSTLKLGPG